MKVQIRNFSAHQTAKVFAILMVISMLVFMIPLSVLTSFGPSPVDQSGNEISAGFFLWGHVHTGTHFPGIIWLYTDAYRIVVI